MIYDDLELREELLTLLKRLMDKEENYVCPYCENDLRKPFDCKNCGEDRCVGKHCYREGKHYEYCLLAKHEALLSIEIELTK